MCDHLVELGSDVGVKRTRTLLAWLGLEAIYPSDLRPSRKQESIRLQPEFYFFAPPPRIPSRRICRPGNFNKGFSARLRSIKK